LSSSINNQWNIDVHLLASDMLISSRDDRKLPIQPNHQAWWMRLYEKRCLVLKRRGTWHNRCLHHLFRLGSNTAWTISHIVWGSVEAGLLASPLC